MTKLHYCLLNHYTGYFKIIVTISLFLCFGSLTFGIPPSYPLMPVQADTVLNIGSRLELFVDNYMIDHFTGKAELRLHHPEPKEIVIVHDDPWEGNGSGYHSIFRDGDKYKMYYKAWQLTITPDDRKINHPNPGFCCYAESKDGIHWYKPKLNLYESGGSKENNIVFINGLMEGINADGRHPAVFKDENPDVPSNALYKAVLTTNQTKGLCVFQSPDGINWKPLTNLPVITDGAFDSQNLMFWDGVNEEYRAYWRWFESIETSPPTKVRAIRTAKSKDLINWYDQKDLSYDDSPMEELYTNQIKPYYRAPHIFIGFPARYIDRGWSASMQALPESEHRELRSSVSQRYGTALTEALFMASRDGVLFKRWNEAFMRPGIEREGTWNYGHQYVGWSIVETKSALEGAPNELSLYAVENYWTETSSSLRRYTLRVDGFVSVYAPMRGGEVITKPLVFKGSKLALNFSSSVAGDIRVEIQDINGIPIPGFSLGECPPVFGDTLERMVSWDNGSDLSSLAGKPVKLRFVLKDADLYSLQFK